jgi:hypothetical protein
MFANMASQGGRAKLKQSGMRRTLSMAKMTKGGFSCAVIDETQQLLKKPRAQVQEMQK